MSIVAVGLIEQSSRGLEPNLKRKVEEILSDLILPKEIIETLFKNILEKH